MIVSRALLVGIFAVVVCAAQSVTIKISGKVTDTGGTAISGAILTLVNAGLTATTGADGNFTFTSTGVHGQNNQSLTHRLSAAIHNGVLYVNLQEELDITITTFTLQGKAISTLKRTMGAGTHFLALPMMSAGVYLYKVKFGGSEFMIKSPLIDGISHGTATSVQGSSSNALAKQAKRAAAFNDAILATKDGYLNYRMGITNSDTSGIQIKMIVCAGTVTDADGNVYQTVRIGTQVWMVENLKTTRYNNGMAIPLVTDDAAWAALTTPGYCWYKNDSTSYKNPYGALYNGYVVNTDKLAPTGWHVAMDADWATLTAYLGGDSVAGGKLKEAGLAHWASPNTGATNETGFSALPGGYCDDGGTFNFIGNLGYWWSSTALDATYSWYRDVYYGNEFVYRYANCFSTYGFSVRCLRD